MKRVLGTVVLVLALVLVAVPAAGAAVSPTEKRLLKDVATLKKQVKTLQKQSKDNESFAAAALVVAMCSTAMSADTFQATWAVIDQIAQATQAKTYFGPQTPVNDAGVCQALQLTRPRTASVAGFSSLLGLLQGSNAIVAAVKLPF